MKIYLHIGTHKTGTTSIQSFACDHRGALSRHGIHWPAEKLARHPRQHSGLAQLIRDEMDDEAEAYIRRAIAAAIQANANCLLLSGENFSHFTAAEVARLKGMLAPHDVTIILYFRNIYGYALSSLHQKLKKDASEKSLAAIVSAIRGNLDYSGTLQLWEEGFGPNAIALYCFDSEKGSLLENFYDRIGMPAAAVRTCLGNAPEYRNESLDLPTQLMLGALGAITSKREVSISRRRYHDAFAGSPLKVPVQTDISIGIASEGAADLSHPRLAPMREALLLPPAEIAAPSAEARVAYLRSLAKFSRRLADDLDPAPSLWTRLRRRF